MEFLLLPFFSSGSRYWGSPDAKIILEASANKQTDVFHFHFYLHRFSLSQVSPKIRVPISDNTFSRGSSSKGVRCVWRKSENATTKYIHKTWMVAYCYEGATGVSSPFSAGRSPRRGGVHTPVSHLHRNKKRPLAAASLPVRRPAFSFSTFGFLGFFYQHGVLSSIVLV